MCLWRTASQPLWPGRALDHAGNAMIVNSVIGCPALSEVAQKIAIPEYARFTSPQDTAVDCLAHPFMSLDLRTIVLS